VGGWVRVLKVGQLTLSMGPARAEFRSYVQRAIIPGKRVVYTLKYSQNAIHSIIDNTCLIWKVKYISPLQVKNKTCDRDGEHAFILCSMDCTVGNTSVAQMSPRTFRCISQCVSAYIWTFPVHFPQKSSVVEDEK
jgi:hypothetical protein